MHMVVELLLVAVAGVVAIALLSATRRPDTFLVQREAVMNAAPERVFAEVDDLHRWMQWSPWTKLDPACRYTYAGPEHGVGSSVAWEGNKKAGAGKMTIVESLPGALVNIRLEFLKPFAATNEAVFSFAAEGAATRVRWTMTGKNNFFFKLMHAVMNMDKMVGPDFERGLGQLKAVVEQK